MLKNKIGHFNKNDTLMVIGANHRSSTMLLRDQLYIPSADLPNFYKRLKEIGFKQSIILSTNDLTEFILIAPNHLTNELSVEVIKLLAAHTKESRNKIRNQTYFLFNQCSNGTLQGFLRVPPLKLFPVQTEEPPVA